MGAEIRHNLTRQRAHGRAREAPSRNEPHEGHRRWLNVSSVWLTSRATKLPLFVYIFFALVIEEKEVLAPDSMGLKHLRFGARFRPAFENPFYLYSISQSPTEAKSQHSEVSAFPPPLPQSRHPPFRGPLEQSD